MALVVVKSGVPLMFIFSIMSLREPNLPCNKFWHTMPPRHPTKTLPHCLSMGHCQTLYQQGNHPNATPQQPEVVSSPFFWSLNTVIGAAARLGGTIPRGQIRDLPFTVKHNGAVHDMAQ